MTTLGELATIVRSKNAGPFRITFDIFFKDHEDYMRIANQEILTTNLVSELYNLPEEDVLGIFYLEHINAIKVSIVRPTPAGSFDETDVYGAQQHVPLLSVDVAE